MCGIAGIVDRDLEAPIPEADIAAMVRALTHRGPDGDGTVCRPGVALGMRRLAIIDVATGQQPIANETGTVHIVANGEIYNFLELQQQLRACGHTFRSLASDIEVLVHGYEEWGEGLPSRIRGMFAFAIWDARSRSLFVARDRAGEKPLYWTLTPRGLVFASEVKALLTRPEVSRDLDPEALDQFLTYEYVVTPRTMLRGVHTLPAGSHLRYQDGRVDVRRYWDPAAIEPRTWTDGEAATALRETLQRAVSSQLMSEVPLGAFLSGGIDSSAVVALMSRASSLPVKTFSMGFEDGSYNELPFAREVAALFRTEHTERLVTPDIASLFDRLVPHLDDALRRRVAVPDLSRLAGGARPRHRGAVGRRRRRALRRLRRLRGPRRRLAVPVGRGAAGPGSGGGGGRAAADRTEEGARQQVQALHRRGRRPPRPTSSTTAGWCTWARGPSGGSTRRPSPPPSTAATSTRRCARCWRAAAATTSLNRQLFTDLVVYLADDILVKVDRMSMATSLETRAPFLDVDVMELAFSMPGSLKVRDGVRKYVLKQAMHGLVPDRILHRRKEGFSIPMKNWLRRELEPLMRDLLSPERMARRGLVEPAEVARLMDAHVAGRENHAHTLFPLMVFERWADAHLR